VKDDEYESRLEALQLALVRTQAAAIKSGERICVVLEGRDAAGKDGTIARVTQHLSTRATRIISLPKPSDRETSQWWFQRYADHLPAAGELVIFNRSWYNRGGVERVMGFSTPEQQEQFLRDAPVFEQMLVESGLKLVKYWLDISKDEQAKRLESRRKDPLKQLKVSDMDAVAQDKWDAYSSARDEMLTRTHTSFAPWICVHADHKRPARLALMAHLVRTVGPKPIASKIDVPDEKLLFPFELEAITDGRLEK
jgi:polyphosphate kinase 2